MKDEEKGAIPSEEKEVEELARAMCSFSKNTLCRECSDACFYKDYAKRAIDKGWRKQSEWISVEERLPTEDEYLTQHNDRLSSLKRLTVAYMTDTIEYTIGCYDGYKWMNQLGNKKINDVVAWKPFEIYKAPKGGGE